MKRPRGRQNKEMMPKAHVRCLPNEHAVVPNATAVRTQVPREVPPRPISPRCSTVTSIAPSRSTGARPVYPSAKQWHIGRRCPRTLVDTLFRGLTDENAHHKIDLIQGIAIARRRSSRRPIPLRCSESSLPVVWVAPIHGSGLSACHAGASSRRPFRDTFGTSLTGHLPPIQRDLQHADFWGCALVLERSSPL